MIAGIVMAIIAFVALTVMVSLFLAAPFGTLAYLAIFGFFDIWASGAAARAHHVLPARGDRVPASSPSRACSATSGSSSSLLLTVLLTLLTMLLHSIVPIILVSITDALAALIIAIVGAIWGLLMLIGGIISLVKQLNLGRQGGGPLREREASEPATSRATPRRRRRRGAALARRWRAFSRGLHHGERARRQREAPDRHDVCRVVDRDGLRVRARQRQLGCLDRCAG